MHSSDGLVGAPYCSDGVGVDDRARGHWAGACAVFHLHELFACRIVCYAIPQHGDPRGVFAEMLKMPDCGQFSYFTAYPDKFVEQGETKITHAEEYTSHNTTRLDVEGMKTLLLKLDFMRRIARGNMRWRMSSSCERKTMISEQTIQQAALVLGEAAKPAQVILFGSYARGDAREDSDVDFLVIEPDLRDKFNEMVRLRQVLRPLRIPVDVLVYSQAEIDELRSSCAAAVYWALREGKVLYATPH